MPCAPPGAQGQASHALWVSWALMEAQQGDATAVRYLFKRGLDVGPRSRWGRDATLYKWCIVSSMTSITPHNCGGPHVGRLRCRLQVVLWLGRVAEVLPVTVIRYLHLAWAMWEKQNGNVNNARKLLDRGQRLNPRDAPILQVGCCSYTPRSRAAPVFGTLG